MFWSQLWQNFIPKPCFSHCVPPPICPAVSARVRLTLSPVALCIIRSGVQSQDHGDVILWTLMCWRLEPGGGLGQTSSWGLSQGGRTNLCHAVTITMTSPPNYCYFLNVTLSVQPVAQKHPCSSSGDRCGNICTIKRFSLWCPSPDSISRSVHQSVWI